MSVRTTIGLLIAVLAAAAAIWLLRVSDATSGARALQQQRLLPEAPRDVSWFTVTGPGVTIECARRDDVWRLERPIRARADAGRIRWLFDTLEGLPREETIAPVELKARELGAADYGLDASAACLAFGRLNSRREIRIGRRAPLGDLVYVCLPPRPDIVATSARLLDVLPQSADALRDRRVIHGDPARIGRLEIQRPGGGFVRLARDARGAWLLQQPLAARADEARVGVLLEALAGLEAKRFVWDPPVAPAPGDDPAGRAEQYQLAPDTANARIGAWFKGEEVGYELLLGRDAADAPGEIYARREDEPGVFTVDRSVLDLFSVSGPDVRDRAVFSIDPGGIGYLAFRQGDAHLALERAPGGGWALIEPEPWPADPQIVEALLQQLTRLQIETFVAEATPEPLPGGLANPWRTIALAGARPAPGAADEGRQTLCVGDAATNTALRYARLEGTPGVFLIDATALRDLGADAADPLALHDRTVLALPPATVRSIALNRAGRLQTVVRRDDGTWAPGPGEAGACDGRAIAGLLADLSHLRAARVESRDAADLAHFGLDAPPLTLSLGLSAEEGIGKSLRVGFRAKTEGAYAMVQGQGLIFILGVDVVERLSRDLILAPAEAAR
jgi:hypothetical protein